MTSFPVHQIEPTEVMRVEVDPYADMHEPSRPYRIVLFSPELNVLDTDQSDAVKNLSFAELKALESAVFRLVRHVEQQEKKAGES